MPDVPGDSSVDLLMKAQAGDGDALDQLLARYLPRLRRWASGRLPSSARTMMDTGDLVQDAVISALRHLSTLEVRTDGAFLVYLRKSVNNRIIDAYRRAGRRPERLELPEDAPANSTSPFDAVVGAEAVDRYDAALSRLTEDERRAIVLRVELGYDYSELAVELGKPSVDAARMAVTRAIARLAGEMRDGRP